MNANPSLHSVPDAIEPVVGWRTWRITRTDEGLRLAPVAWYLNGSCWPARERFEASCRRGFRSAHDAPHRLCACGIHAAKEVKGARPFINPSGAMGLNVVWLGIGRVYLWGKIIEHTDGYRAQYAYPKQILLPEEIRNTTQDVTAPNLNDIADELREAYGVPVLIVHTKPSLLDRLKGVR